MNNISLVNHKNCFSCRSCLYSCPKNAIEMKESSEGFFYPYVNEKCVDCGICVKVCPLDKTYFRDISEQHGKLLYLQDENKLKESSSGGAFSGFAEHVLENEGVVFGAAYDNELNVNQIYIKKIEDLYKLKGSKYVESFTNDSFVKVKEFLESDSYVLYSGTPCQIAGLKSFLRKDYEKLITIDLICHGVPSRKLFNKYLGWLGKKYDGKIVYYGFRDKDIKGWSCDGKIKIKTKTKTKTKKIEYSCDPYYASFLRGDSYRESCYSCPFSSLNRPGDITIGDFWGVEKYFPDLQCDKGVSCCIINTKKGKDFFFSAKGIFYIQDANLNDIVENNHNLSSATIRPKNRDFIYESIQKDEFDISFIKFDSEFLFGIKKIIRYFIPAKIILILKKMIRGSK